RLTELARSAYATLTSEGADSWDEPVPDFTWDLTPIGLGRYEGLPAFRDFFRDWVSSYDDWFMELLDAEELSDSVIVISARQGAGCAAARSPWSSGWHRWASTTATGCCR